MEEYHNINVKKAIALSGLLVLLLVVGSSIAMAAGSPQASFKSNATNGYTPLSVQFTDKSTGSNITSWSWDFGDGETSIDKSPVHTYTKAGTYTVSLTVTDENGETDTDEETDYMTVKPGPDPTKPVANFSGSPVSGNAPLNVKFTDMSTGKINSWYWDFGDKTHSNSKNPSHIYKKYGSYSVTLTVKDTTKGLSNTITKSQYINVTELPVADFKMNTSSGYDPLTVQFTDKSAYAATWSWDFGDGATSTEKNPIHTYLKAGTYTVKLTVTSATKQTSSKLDTVTVVPVLPEADFKSNVTKGNAPLTVQFTDNSKHATGWKWDFGDGATSDKQNPVHTYSVAGDYTVTLTASNAEGTDADEEPGYIHVDPGLVADFSTSSTSGNAPLKVTFTDKSTGSPTSWLWTFGDGTRSKSKNTVHTYTKPGTYTATLTIKSANGATASKFVTITVTQLPVADFSVNTTNGFAPLSVQFTDKSTGATGWNWNFGDGATSTDKNPVHTYSKKGTYSANLTVNNANGATSKVVKIIVKNPPLPVADFTSNINKGNAPLKVQFTDKSTGSPTSWNWNFGDGATSTDKNPVHTYTKGTYTVTLTVSNAAGTDTDEEEGYINVDAGLVAAFSMSPTSGNAPLKITFTDKSTGSPTSWNWNFGDGSHSKSKSKNITHTYSKAGKYSVTLTITDANGATASSKPATVNVTSKTK
ncbi:MAG TPA: PKD domain-containing protein [Methanosarcina sp.]